MVYHQNRQLNKSHTSTQTSKSTHISKSVRKKEFKIILGSNVRSKNGCLTCRKRKKKCPEDGPVCKSCKLRVEDCIWPGIPPRTKVVDCPKQSQEQNKNFTNPCVSYSSANGGDKIQSLGTLKAHQDEKDEEIDEAMDDIGHANLNVFTFNGGILY